MGDLHLVHLPVAYTVYRSVAEHLTSTLNRCGIIGVFNDNLQSKNIIFTYIAVGKNPYFGGDNYDESNDQFLKELIRLTSVIRHGAVSLLSDEIARGTISERERDSILSQLIFFTLALFGDGIETIQENRIDGMQLTSLTPTEYMKSLTTLTDAEITG